MNTNINFITKKLLPYIFIFLLAYLINTIISLYLPKSGVEFIKNDLTSLSYKNYNGFYSNTKTVQKSETKAKKIETLSKYNLKGIYSTNKNSGWITIEDKAKQKSKILAQWEEIDGYILTKLYKTYVVFEKEAKEYKLAMKEKDKVSYEIEQNVNSNENIKVNDDLVKIKRDFLNTYVTNVEKVWNNIAIKEIKKAGKIDGFKINKIAKNSVFEKIGLKQGDIIKAVNNNVLGSYADAFKVYNNINNTKYLNIEILRNNEMMELNYEID